MILVVGGLASGKREYVKNEYGFEDCDMADGVLDDSPVVYNLQNLIMRNPDAAASLIEQLIKKSVVICNEVGCGIVPVSEKEREAREVTGRLCVALATGAQRVIRMQCGIPVIIKG